MEAFKEKQYLVFRFEDGKDVRYDLSNGQTIGKSGRPVKDICTQLRGYGILKVIDSFQDENYRNFLKFVDSRVNASTSIRYHGNRVDKITNVGSFLSKVQKYSNYEQIFACGIKKVDPYFNCSISDIPKGLLKLCREYDLVLDRNLLTSYKKDPNTINNLMSMKFNSLNNRQILGTLYQGRYYSYCYERFNELVNSYNYKSKSLLTYIDNLITYEALDGFENTVRELHDYARMMSRISPKYEKYPKNFLTTHKIACRNYNRLKEQFVEEDFKKRIDKSLEYSYGDYKFIYPESTQDIKDEASMQNNCVASYIKNVINGECHILFLRKKDNLDHSLVTIEVRDNQIVQAKGKFNRDVTEEEQEIIDKWNEKFKKMEEAA